MPNFEVSIEQDDCTSCGLCPEIAKRHFFMGEDNLAYVKEDSEEDPAEPEFLGFAGKVAVAADIEHLVIEAAESCPGECIYVETAEASQADLIYAQLIHK